MSDDTVPESDTQDDVQDDAREDTTNALCREDIPETAHITACGVVISDDGERLGKVDPHGVVPSTSNPRGSGGESTASNSGDSE